MSNEGDEGDSSNKGPQDFPLAVARVAAAQVCEGVGFEGVKRSALDALSAISLRYISDLGKSANHYASLAGRLECNVFDVVKALEDLASASGFSTASDPDCCAVSSGALREVLDFVATAEEIPFAHPIPRFPVSKKSGSGSGSGAWRLSETSRGKHVPEWLPPFPDPREEERSESVSEQERERKEADDAVARRIVESAAAGPSDDGSEGNPFLAVPLPAGEKEVSQIAVPTRLVSTEGKKKLGPLVVTFASAIDAARDREPDFMDVEKGIPLERRSVVHFRLKKGKKMLNENVDVGIRDRGGEGRVPALSVDDKRDEKKRRAEQILKQSMMNPQETPENENAM